MENIWFILINGNKEGPYNLIDLKGDCRITPDTLVWRHGFKKWVPIRKVQELKAVFEDSTKPEEENVGENNAKKLTKKRLQDDEVIALRSEPPFAYLWLFIVLILLYVLYQFYK